uniref:Receptor ligand binding region domain-containing protein n=1 Tax=Hucho hucho TaxID=62062 RepID=A0A4W5MG25_9TELE
DSKLSLSCVYVCVQMSPSLHRNITLAIILPQRNTAYPWAWPRVGPALDRAINTINADPALLRGHHLGYVFENSENEEGICSESIAPLMAVDLKFAHDPWAFIGPGCDYTSSPVGLFTTHWDIPMITAGAPAVGFNGINMYPSITNTGPTHKKLGKFGLHICKHFEWKEQVLLMFSDNKKDDRPCYFAVEGLYTELHLNNITSVDLVFEENTGPEKKTEMVFVCCSPDTFRQLMVHFRRAGLPQEDFVFFYIDMFGRSLDSQNAQPWARGDQDDLVAKEAFQVSLGSESSVSSHSSSHSHHYLGNRYLLYSPLTYTAVKPLSYESQLFIFCLSQSVKILTYREPQNPEYKDFVRDLKTDAKRMFNFTVEDSLVRGCCVCGGGGLSCRKTVGDQEDEN